MSENKPLRIVAVGAHPDDIEFGCGGILLKEAGRASQLSLVLCSRGESGSNGTAEQRTDEAESAAAQLGAALRFLEMGGDGMITPRKENVLMLASAFRELKPHIVLAPTLEPNQHPDHIAVGKAVCEAARLARYGGLDPLEERPAWAVGALLHYAITPGGEPERRPDFLCDISGFEEAWEALMRCHKSQMQTRRYVELQLSRARVWGLQSGASHAQALWSDDSIRLQDLSAVARAARAF